MNLFPLLDSPDQFDHDIGYESPLRADLLAACGKLARHHRLHGELRHVWGGSNFIAAIGEHYIFKLFPPFHRYQWETEVQVLKYLNQQQVSVPIPEFYVADTEEQWSYLIMSYLPGQTLESIWPEISEDNRCELLSQIGNLMKSLHALPAKDLPLLDPPWDLFWQHQQEHVIERHRKQGFPAHLLADLPVYLEAELSLPVPLDSTVLLTGEYTPMNLMMTQKEGRWHLSAMFDFADTMVGPAFYDLLGPICFLVAGQRPRLDAFLAAYGLSQWDDKQMSRLCLSYLLLHRYSNPRFQIKMADWQQAESLDALAGLVWPAIPTH